MRKFLLRTAIAGATASGALALMIGAGGPAAHAACPPQYNGNPVHTNVISEGPVSVYTSGPGGAPTVPPSTTNNYIGVNVQGQGFAEANGGSGANPTTNGYIVATNGSAGILVQGIPPAIPPTC